MIEYRDVWKSFGDQVVLRGINLTIEEGQSFFLLGKTGAGKTVLIRLLVGLLHADKGQILVDDEDITGLSEKQFQRFRIKCGMVFQFPTLFDSMTVAENVGFALRRHTDLDDEQIHQRVLEDLELVGLGPDVIHRLPHELSFGMQKRVGLARTIAMRPRYLLYDEPTTGLDPFTASQINKLMCDLSDKLKVTSIVVSHDLDSMLEVADRVALLDNGGLLEINSPDQFVKSANPVVQHFISGKARAEDIL